MADNTNLKVDLVRRMRSRLRNVHLEQHEIEVLFDALKGNGLSNFLVIVIEEIRHMDNDTFFKLCGIQGILRTSMDEYYQLHQRT